MFTVALLGLVSLQAASPDFAFTIDARKQTLISPYIYGINYPDSFIDEWLKEWDGLSAGVTLAREGGNRFTAYNWETNASNAGQDYFFENDDYLGVSNEAGLTVRKFLEHVQSKGAASLLTVPTLGFVAADKDNARDGGQDVNHTPDFLHKRFLPSVARKPSGHFEYPPNTKDSVVYQDEFVHWVESVKKPNAPVWFSLDNEPDLWAGTHARIRAKTPTYAEIIDNGIEYASAIKAVAPKALVFGPANYGWYGFRAFQGAPDANGRVFVDAYLDAMKQAESKWHRRLLDSFDFHWYPEATGDGVRITMTNQADKPGTAMARIQAPRSLWDPTYVEDSWIPKSNGNKPIRLLPDMQERVLAQYPGTKLSISEYDFGGRSSISGALAEADALGIFGRYRLFAACHWGLGAKDEAALAGFEAFSNYDRHGSRFGDRGLQVAGGNPALNSVYASLDSKRRGILVLVVINKGSESQNLSMNLTGFHPRDGKAFVVKEGIYLQPLAGMLGIKNGTVLYTAPPFSVSTLEVQN